MFTVVSFTRYLKIFRIDFASREKGPHSDKSILSENIFLFGLQNPCYQEVQHFRYVLEEKGKGSYIDESAKSAYVIFFSPKNESVSESKEYLEAGLVETS